MGLKENTIRLFKSTRELSGRPEGSRNHVYIRSLCIILLGHIIRDNRVVINKGLMCLEFLMCPKA